MALGGKGLMFLFPVSKEKNEWLKERMEILGIHEREIEEKFIRSSGRGGQKVNKTSTCVYLRHIPTGIEVKCMRGRSQSLNRFLARRELIKKVEMRLGVANEKEALKKKLIKQKLKRTKRAMQKYHRSEDG